jgi:hypothetical protein
MAQLKQDEWPNDNEPTTAEVEGDAFKSEHPHPPVDAERRADPSGARPRTSRTHDVEPNDKPS